jgi:hypothetical protein
MAADWSPRSGTYIVTAVGGEKVRAFVRRLC